MCSPSWQPHPSNCSLETSSSFTSWFPWSQLTDICSTTNRIRFLNSKNYTFIWRKNQICKFKHWELRNHKIHICTIRVLSNIWVSISQECILSLRFRKGFKIVRSIWKRVEIKALSGKLSRNWLRIWLEAFFSGNNQLLEIDLLRLMTIHT